MRVRHARFAARMAAATAGVALMLLPAGCSSTASDRGSARSAATRSVVRPPLTAEQRALNVASFDYVWQTVRDRHWDPDLGGLDWQAVRLELRPRVESAESMDAARGVMREALDRLKQSHFAIISGEVYSQVSDAGVEEPTDMPAKKDGPGANGSDARSGMELRVVDGVALVTRVEPGSGADRAGVRPGWIVESIRGRPTDRAIAAMSEQLQGPEAAAMIVRGFEGMISGAAGSVVPVGFLDGEDQPVIKPITLDPPPGAPVRFGHLPPVHVEFVSTRLAGNIGYIRFNFFLDPGRVMPMFASAMESFATAQGVILDLRGNLGGIGFMANGMSGFFVDKEGLKLGEMRTRDTTVNFVIFPRVEVYGGPVAILVDELSYSTSEIMAGGLQDLGRARIFGSRTGGGALPSTIEKLPNGDGFQFAMANYVSASGRVLEGEGVVPDEEVRIDRATLLRGLDPAVEAAKAWIQSGPLMMHR
ncbi:MAG: hypothetical protein KF787_02130 [Phycisphaeraceae bacterium]|nr:hypothetical protein [Phycisphaerae bacterium]MBX3391423.1 hypothetical protein [Phycisphaeraceae bacterium]